MSYSVESASTPIANGGWQYDPEIDRDDFAGYTGPELEAERGYDFSAHPARGEQPVSYTETWSTSDGLADLALDRDLEERLRNALDGTARHEIKAEVEDAINAQLAEHGVDTDTGEWLGQWSAGDIVRTVLDRRGGHTQ